MGTLDDKVAVVVGGAGGIGSAITARLGEEGARVFATSRAASPQAPAEGNVRAVRADASSRADLDEVFRTIHGETGRVDILVVNAGLSEFATLSEVGEDHFNRTFGLNVGAPLFAAQKAAELMPAGGAIVLIGSIAGDIGTKGYGVYGATKAAVRAFARTWANELAPRGIRVNVVSPGPIDTPMMAAASDEVRTSLTGLIPLGRMGRPEEVAAAVNFLVGSESTFITGVELCVDGGMAQV